MDRPKLQALNATALTWLQSQPQLGAGDPKAQYAYRYALGRYAVGLPHYGAAFEKLGFVDAGPGLDIGSGAGHWANAYAAMNRVARGVELRPEFVTISNAVTAAIGLSGQAVASVGDAASLPFEDAAFDTAWCHGVLMFAAHGAALQEANRVLRSAGRFYLAYTALGQRLRTLARGGDDAQTVQARRGALITLFNHGLYRAGVDRTPDGRTRCCTRAEIERLCRWHGLEPVAAPDIQDGSRGWEGLETTFDLLARKTGDVRSGLMAKAEAAGDDGALMALAGEALADGAPEAARQLVDIGGIDPARADVRRLRVGAALKSGRLTGRMRLEALLLRRDRSEAATLLRAMIALDRRRYAAAAALAARAGGGRVAGALLTAALVAGGRHKAALAAAEAGAALRPDDFLTRLALLRALDGAGEIGRLRAETAALLDGVRAGMLAPAL